jgi:hypothetical protein
MDNIYNLSEQNWDYLLGLYQSCQYVLDFWEDLTRFTGYGNSLVYQGSTTF